MKPSPEFSLPQVHRVSAYIFGEIWPRMVKEVIPDASPIDRLQKFMSGLAVCDYIIFPNSQTEKSKNDAETAFSHDFKTSQWIATKAVKEKKRLFNRPVKILAEKSTANRAQLWYAIVSRADRYPSGDYWDSAEFLKLFEGSYGLKIGPAEDHEKFTNALKNKKAAIRKAEERHWKQFEELIIDCAVQAEMSEKGNAAAAKLRKSLSRDRKRIGEYLVKILRAYPRDPSGSR